MNETKASVKNVEVKSIVQDIQAIISISYIVAVGIGMLFNFKKFAAFGINIFEYADVLDFLIAPFADRIIVLFTLASMLIAFFLFKLDLYWERSYPKSYARASMGLHTRSWYTLFRYMSSALVFAVYLYISANIYARIKMKALLGQPETTLRFADNEVKRGIIIGKTKEMIFLLVKENVHIIPLTSSVKEFQIK